MGIDYAHFREGLDRQRMSELDVAAGDGAVQIVLRQRPEGDFAIEVYDKHDREHYLSVSLTVHAQVPDTLPPMLAASLAEDLASSLRLTRTARKQGDTNGEE